MKHKLHAAVNHITEDAKAVLVRLKELGEKAPSLRLSIADFGETAPVKHENFVIEADGFLQRGNYLYVAGHCKIADREMSEAVPFDPDAYLASLKKEEEPPF